MPINGPLLRLIRGVFGLLRFTLQGSGSCHIDVGSLRYLIPLLVDSPAVFVKGAMVMQRFRDSPSHAHQVRIGQNDDNQY